jgi:hypothetical protein
MDKIEKGIAPFILLSSLLSLAFEPPWIDLRQFGARPVQINTIGSGSGHSLTVGTDLFQQGANGIPGDGITVAGAGQEPQMHTPGAPTVTPGIAATLTVPDALLVAGANGSSTYAYRLFARDVLGSKTAAGPITTIDSGPAALGASRIQIATWGLTGNTLTFTTSQPSRLAKDALFHSTLTTNAELSGGWFPVSGASPNSFMVNNVPQSAPTTKEDMTISSGKGGVATYYVGNAITWSPINGGSGVTSVYEVFVCAKRPGDSVFHIVGTSLPNTFYSENHGGIVSTRFVDFGWNDPILPWYVSDADCNAKTPTPSLFTTRVDGGGGTKVLHIADALPRTVTNALIRFDNAQALKAGLAAAVGARPLLIPSDGPNAQYVINSAVATPWKVTIWQQGDLALTEPLIVGSDVTWTGTLGKSNLGAPSFSSTGTPVVYCNAYPCVYVSSLAGSQAAGADTVESLTFLTGSQNGLLVLIDSGWGETWYRDTFITGSTNLDNAGIAVLIRPGGAEYKFIEDNFGGGPNQVIDQSWTPMFHAAAGMGSQCCGVPGNVGTLTVRDSMWNRRGFYELANGGPGISLEVDHAYRQGGITPFFAVQNINGHIDGQISITYAYHDTESQAAYAWFCNLGCTPGGGPPFFLGFTNSVSVDQNTRPLQITGGGNSAINPLGSPISSLRSR